MKKSNLTTVLAESSAPFVDAAVGAALSVLEGVPVLGMAVTFSKGLDDLRSRLFEAKLKSFVEGLGNHSQEEIDAMIAEISDPHEREQVGETLLLVLENYNALYKCELLGKLYSAYLKKLLGNVSLRRLSMAISAAFPDDLKAFLNGDLEPDHNVNPEFFSFLELTGLTKNNGGWDGGLSEVTFLGREFRSVIRKLDESPPTSTSIG